MLFVIGADTALKQRLETTQFPCPVLFFVSVPAHIPLGTLFLIPYPQQKQILSSQIQTCLTPDSPPEASRYQPHLPPAVPVIACGSPQQMASALRDGCADYVCEPWTQAELAARFTRFLPDTPFHHAAGGLTLCKTTLSSPSGCLSLSSKEATLLRILWREKGKNVARTALQTLLWPHSPTHSRVVDEAVSRLRKKLCQLGISRLDMEIRSNRCKGYTLVTF